MTAPSLTAADFGIAEWELTSDMPRHWEVTFTGDKADGGTYWYGTGTKIVNTVTPPTAELVDLNITFDASQTPRCTGTFVIIPHRATAEQIRADLDPRRYGAVFIAAKYGDRATVDTFATLRIVEVTEDEGIFTVVAHSAEYQLLEVSSLPVQWKQPAPLPAAKLIASLITDAAGVNPVVVWNDPIFNPEGLTGNEYDLGEIADVWAAIQTVVDSEGWRLYGPALPLGNDRVQIVVADSGTGLSKHEVQPLQDGINTRAISRDGYATIVNVVHSWTTIDGEDETVIGTAADTGPYADNQRRLVINRDSFATRAMAEVEAQSILTRARTRAITRRIEAIAAYWIRPDDIINLSGETETYIVESVVFNIKGLMVLTCRGTPDWWTIGRTAATYATIASVTAAYATIGDLANNNPI